MGEGLNSMGIAGVMGKLDTRAFIQMYTMGDIFSPGDYSNIQIINQSERI